MYSMFSGLHYAFFTNVCFDSYFGQQVRHTIEPPQGSTSLCAPNLSSRCHVEGNRVFSPETYTPQNDQHSCGQVTGQLVAPPPLPYLGRLVRITWVRSSMHFL
jgi:hypothetical protein